MRRVLIISPYFPPDNAADMHRIRISLGHYAKFNWDAEVVAVNPANSDMEKDDLLLQSIPSDIIIHTVNALPKKWTIKIGLGSIALRSLYYYLIKVNQLLQLKKYDLIFFSTTQFPVCILGAYWKKRFGIPYVIDMQDAWHSEYYTGKPKEQQPSKHWFSYRLNRWLEPIAMKHVDGLISVSQVYIDTLKNRYSTVRKIPTSVITFGAFKQDFSISEMNADKLKMYVKPKAGKINVVYVGRGGHDMQTSVKLVFLALLKGLSLKSKLFERYHLYFIGTSYAARGTGVKTVQPLAEQLRLKDRVTEITDRIGFYESIFTLQNADILFIPGSDDPGYTASKLYPYLMSQKAILAIFHEESSAVKILRTCSPNSKLLTFPGNQEEMINHIYLQLLEWASKSITHSAINPEAFQEYTAMAMTGHQTALFNQTII